MKVIITHFIKGEQEEVKGDHENIILMHHGVNIFVFRLSASGRHALDENYLTTTDSGSAKTKQGISDKL